MITFPYFNGLDLGGFINKLYSISVGIVGLLIFIRVLQAGFYYFGSAVGTTNNKGTELVKDALIGAFILLSAHLILTTINPDLTKTNLFDLKQIAKDNINPYPNIEWPKDALAESNRGKDKDPILKAQAIEDALKKAGITKDDNVILAGLRASAVNAIISVKRACPTCKINVVSGTEGASLTGQDVIIESKGLTGKKALAEALQGNKSFVIDGVDRMAWTNPSLGYYIDCSYIGNNCTLTSGIITKK